MYARAQDIVVSLTPVQARRVAEALRLELGLRMESAPLGPVPCRAEIERARALLDDYGERLERLAWGEPRSDLSVRLSADLADALALEFAQAAEECVADPGVDDHREELLSTARALEAAVHGDVEPVVAG